MISVVRQNAVSTPGIMARAAVSIAVRGHRALTPIPSRFNSSANPKTHMLIPYFAIV